MWFTAQLCARGSTATRSRAYLPGHGGPVGIDGLRLVCDPSCEMGSIAHVSDICSKQPPLGNPAFALNSAELNHHRYFGTANVRLST
jgi:hypothetical protein